MVGAVAGINEKRRAERRPDRRAAPEKGTFDMPRIRHRLLKAAAVVAACTLVVATQSAPADANTPQPWSSSNHAGHAPVININVTDASGFTMPKTVHAGYVTFRIGSPDANIHAIDGFRLKHGATVKDAIRDLRDGIVGATFPVNAAGARHLVKHAVLIGGVITTSFAPISVTLPMPDGTYYFLDFEDLINGVTPRVHTIRAVGRPHWTGLPSFSKVIVATNMDSPSGMGDSPGFIAPGRLGAAGTFLAVDGGDELHEILLRQAVPGTTDHYITKFYKAVAAGATTPPSPWLDRQHGLEAISPGQFAVVHIDLPPGLYSWVCYVPDDKSGDPHAWEGMHKIVTLH